MVDLSKNDVTGLNTLIARLSVAKDSGGFFQMV